MLPEVSTFYSKIWGEVGYSINEIMSKKGSSCKNPLLMAAIWLEIDHL
jgi:hypothetical protein